MVQAFALRLIALLPYRYRPTAKQFIKFAITGSVGAFVDFSTYALLTRLIGWTDTYAILGYEISAANNVSVFFAILCNFLINRHWTFKALEGSAAKQGIGYFILNIFTWTLNQLLMSTFTFRVPLFTILFGTYRDFIAKAAAIGIILFLNFFGSKFVIFREERIS